MFFYNITNNRYVLKFDARIHFTKDRQVRTRWIIASVKQ